MFDISQQRMLSYTECVNKQTNKKNKKIENAQTGIIIFQLMSLTFKCILAPIIPLSESIVMLNLVILQNYVVLHNIIREIRDLYLW